MSIGSLALLGIYAFIFLWGLFKYCTSTSIVLGFLFMTLIFVWGVLYLETVMLVFTDPAQYTVADIMADTEHGYLFRYFFERFGALISLAYFGLCFLFIWLLKAIRKN